MSNSIITSKDVSFKYLHADNPFLREINLNISKGECILICGASGSGKSTFSRLLNGISPNYVEGELYGDLYTDGLKAGEATIEEYVPIVGSVFQNPKTQHFAVDTTSELAFSLENTGANPSFIEEQVYNKANAFQIEHLLNRNIFELSGGEKQQLAFVASNMLDPKILILDEVTSNLDSAAIARIRKMVQQLKEQEVTIIILEHRLSWTKDLVDRYVLFEDGKIVNEWSTDEFNHLSSDELYKLGLRSMDLTPHKKMIQEKIRQHEDLEEGIIQTRDLEIGYTNHKVMDKINLQLQAGEITGLMGPNGAGKSTLANTLTGLQKPLSGEIIWDKQIMSPKKLLKKSYLVMQDMNYQLFTESVSDEVILSAKYPKLSKEIIEQLNLSDLKDRHPMSLSEGQKQRVAIASALVSGKELIIFDEPTSGLDYKHMKRFGQLLVELKKSGSVIIVITHDEELAAGWCDRIIELK